MLTADRVRFISIRNRKTDPTYSLSNRGAIVDLEGNEMNAVGDDINGETEPPQFDGYRGFLATAAAFAEDRFADTSV